MKTPQIVIALVAFISSLPLFAQDAGTNVAPRIPEEARKNFIIGVTLFKDAKTPDDFSQAIQKFKQATDLAPQWPEARYNLALAKEAAGDYSGAMADLKLYQQFKLPEDENRKVQDKIYALEAKADQAAKKRATESTDAERKKRDHQDKIGWLAGTWNGKLSIQYPSGPRSIDFRYVIIVSGETVRIRGYESKKDLLLGRIKGDDYRSIEWTDVQVNPPGATSMITQAPRIDRSTKHIHWQMSGNAGAGTTFTDFDLYKQ